MTDTDIDRAIVVEDHLGLVRKAGARWLRASGTFRDDLRDDLRSAGVLALVQSVQRFDPSKGASFSTFASRRVQGAMQDAYRASSLMGKRRGSTRMQRCPESACDTDIRPDYDAGVYARELMAALPTRLQFVVRWYYYDDIELKEIGQRLGVNQSRASQLKAEAMRMMRSAANACA